MKKLFLVSILVILCSGCNKQVFDFEYSYNKVICNYDGEKFELDIDKWKDYEGEQIQIISGNNIYLISTNKCYLVKENKQ